ncbi:MAG: hypothetical protein NT116_04280 [Candidatus Parcubacteria bacterium]|nr:hypothetical protein [Candidatus Parcubacteria bacterium]
MFKRWSGEVEITDEKTGEVIEKRPMCVEADDNVPFGCELGGPRPRILKEDWPILLLLAIIPLTILFIIICGIIAALKPV